MSDRPSVEVCIPTFPNSWERVEYLALCLREVHEKLCVSRHNFLGVHLFVEKAPAKFMRAVDLLAKVFEAQISYATQHPNIGRNMNRISKQSWADYVCVVQDDNNLKANIDLSDAIDFLEQYNDVLILRFRHGQAVLGDRIGDSKMLKVRRRASRYFYSDQMHIRRRVRFNEIMGMQPDRLRLGRAEKIMAQRAVANIIQVAAWPDSIATTRGRMSTDLSRHRKKRLASNPSRVVLNMIGDTK